MDIIPRSFARISLTITKQEQQLISIVPGYRYLPEYHR
jgi:hypothetical protein